MAEFYFYHNTDLCVGCCACQTACKDHNHLVPGEYFRRVSAVTVNGKQRFFSGACNHCEHPACLAVCPNGAYYRAEDGTVLHDAAKCIGCGQCTWACPYGAPALSRTLGIARKCDGCYDRRQEGKNPACVDACINRALQFGRTDGREGGDQLLPTIPGVLPDPSETMPRLRVHCSAAEETP